MLYVKEARGSVAQVGEKLMAAVAANKFGVLGVHDLKERMVAKGVAFGPECRIFEVCNPGQAKQVLEADMSISTVLPCRISVYEEGGKVKVAMLRPTSLLSLFGKQGMASTARTVEDVMICIIDAACQ